MTFRSRLSLETLASRSHLNLGIYNPGTHRPSVAPITFCMLHGSSGVDIGTRKLTDTQARHNEIWRIFWGHSIVMVLAVVEHIAYIAHMYYCIYIYLKFVFCPVFYSVKQCKWHCIALVRENVWDTAKKRKSHNFLDFEKDVKNVKNEWIKNEQFQYNVTCITWHMCNVLQQKCQLAISKWRRVKTWTMLSTFFAFFLNDTSKNINKIMFFGFRKKT